MLPFSHESSSQSSNPTISNQVSEQLSELSEVPCYTCRRRHVRCDRILPHCTKCKKKGIECLGYQRPLRWADGVAVRGKLKGKSQPVVDDNAMNLVSNSIQQQVDSVLQEAAHIGLHPSDDHGNDTVVSGRSRDEIIAYYNSAICSDSISQKETMLYHEIAPLSQEYIQKLPKSILNCLLAISAVYMMLRNPGNTAIERLALEMKINALQTHNQLLRNPQQQLDRRPDVVVSCGVLIFAMDLFDRGTSRWIVHALGMMHVMSSLGGIQNLALYYPHLHVPLLQVSLFETMWVVASHVPLTKYKQCSRNALELLIQSPDTKSKILDGCPASLTFAVWDTAACAQNMLGIGNPISPTCIHTRQRILSDVLSFQPEHGTRALMNEYHQQNPLNAQAHMKYWDLVGEAWKAAITILVLRYLYFGRPELVPPSHSAVGSAYLGTEAEPGYFGQHPGHWQPNQFFEPPNQGFLAAGTYFGNSLSRSPSPMPSPHLPIESTSFDIWETRYDIHMEAFSTLASTLSTLNLNLGPTSLGLVLVPVIILSLVSRANSEERELCTWYISKFLEPMANPSFGPASGETLSFNIPWEKLDEYNEVIEKHRGEEVTTEGSAPEWNWWDMLKHIDLNLSWPVTAGHSHLQQGSEHWAFTLVSSVANEVSFNAWSQDPAPVPDFASSS